MSELHLCSGVRGLGPLGKDVENEIRPVQNFAIQELLYVSQLGRVQFIVKYDRVDFVFPDEPLDFFQLAAAYERLGVGILQLLRESLLHLSACRISQEFQLIEIFPAFFLILLSGDHPDEDNLFYAGISFFDHGTNLRSFFTFRDSFAIFDTTAPI